MQYVSLPWLAHSGVAGRSVAASGVGVPESELSPSVVSASRSAGLAAAASGEGLVRSPSRATEPPHAVSAKETANHRTKTMSFIAARRAGSMPTTFLCAFSLGAAANGCWLPARCQGVTTRRRVCRGRLILRKVGRAWFFGILHRPLDDEARDSRPSPWESPARAMRRLPTRSSFAAARRPSIVPTRTGSRVRFVR